MANATGTRTAKKETRGRHKIDPSEKVMKNNLFPVQWKQVEEVRKARGNKLPKSHYIREAWDFYYSAFLARNGSSVATPEDDEEHEKLVANYTQKKKTQGEINVFQGSTKESS